MVSNRAVMQRGDDAGRARRAPPAAAAAAPCTQVAGCATSQPQPRNFCFSPAASERGGEHATSVSSSDRGEHHQRPGL